MMSFKIPYGAITERVSLLEANHCQCEQNVSQSLSLCSFIHRLFCSSNLEKTGYLLAAFSDLCPHVLLQRLVRNVFKILPFRIRLTINKLFSDKHTERCGSYFRKDVSKMRKLITQNGYAGEL